MFVLTRRIGEQIVIAGNIRVVVLKMTGNKVSLGITAPTSVTVVRQELLRAGLTYSRPPNPTGNPENTEKPKNIFESITE